MLLVQGKGADEKMHLIQALDQLLRAAHVLVHIALFLLYGAFIFLCKFPRKQPMRFFIP